MKLNLTEQSTTTQLVLELRSYYEEEQIEQLVFLWSFRKKYGLPLSFEEYLSILTPCISAECMEQIIKCIVHNLEFEPLLVKPALSALQMNELRRLIEDAVVPCKDSAIRNKMLSLVSTIAQHNLEYRVIYEYRRIFKSDNSVDYECAKSLLDIFLARRECSWMFVGAVCEIFTVCGIDTVQSFLQSIDKKDNIYQILEKEQTIIQERFNL